MVGLYRQREISHGGESSADDVFPVAEPGVDQREQRFGDVHDHPFERRGGGDGVRQHGAGPGLQHGSSTYYTGLLNQPVYFAAGRTTAQVTLTINNPGLTAGAEAFRLIVQQNSTDPTTTYLASDTFTIHNNDVAVQATYSLSPSPASINENSGSATFTITRSSGAAAGTVYVSTVQDQGYSNGSSTYYNGFLNQPVYFAADGHGNTLLTLDANDTLLIVGIRPSDLSSHQGDFVFV